MNFWGGNSLNGLDKTLIELVDQDLAGMQPCNTFDLLVISFYWSIFVGSDLANLVGPRVGPSREIEIIMTVARVEMMCIPNP